MKHIILLRHGQTEHNTKRVFQADEVSLSPLGREQVERYVKQHAGQLKSIEYILHSPLARATETAMILADLLKVPLDSDDSLVELRNPPEIRGQSFDDPQADRAYRAWVDSLYDQAAFGQSNTENYFDMIQRAQKTLHRFTQREESAILVVSHSEFIRTLVALILLGEDMDDLRTIMRTATTIKLGNVRGVAIVHEAHRGWRVVI